MADDEPPKYGPDEEKVFELMKMREGPINWSPYGIPSDMPPYAQPTNPNVSLEANPPMMVGRSFGIPSDVFEPVDLDSVPSLQSMALNKALMAWRAIPDDYYDKAKGLQSDAGGKDLEAYWRRFQMPDKNRDERLMADEFIDREEAKFRGLPEHIKRRYEEARQRRIEEETQAEDLAKKGM